MIWQVNKQILSSHCGIAAMGGRKADYEAHTDDPCGRKIV